MSPLMFDSLFSKLRNAVLPESYMDDLGFGVKVKGVMTSLSSNTARFGAAEGCSKVADVL